MEEYIAYALISCAVAPVVLTVNYFISPKLPENTFSSSECQSIWELTSICGGLLNDIQGFQVLTFSAFIFWQKNVFFLFQTKTCRTVVSEGLIGWVVECSLTAASP